MPKITLTFSLPDEREEFELANGGAKLQSGIDDYKNWLRAQLKYNDKLNDEQSHMLEQAQTKLFECLNND